MAKQPDAASGIIGIELMKFIMLLKKISATVAMLKY